MVNVVVLMSVVINVILIYKYEGTRLLNWLQASKGFVKKFLHFFGLYHYPLLINTPFAYYANETAVRNLIAGTSKSAMDLPDELLISPGNYRFYQQTYDVTAEGLYRFVYPENSNQQRIVFQQNISALLSSIAWIVTHGETDDHLSHYALLAKAKYSKLYLTCERVTRFAYELMMQLGIRVRIVGTRTLDQWETYDNGHYLLEVYRADLQKWVLYDLDNNAYFQFNNNPLSLLEFTEHKNKQYQIVYIANDMRIKTVNRRFDYAFVDEARIANLQHWYQRIIQFVYIEEQNTCYAYHPHEPIEFAKYPKGMLPAIQYLQRELFVKRFYQ